MSILENLSFELCLFAIQGYAVLYRFQTPYFFLEQSKLDLNKKLNLRNLNHIFHYTEITIYRQNKYLKYSTKKDNLQEWYMYCTVFSTIIIDLDNLRFFDLAGTIFANVIKVITKQMSDHIIVPI